MSETSALHPCLIDLIAPLLDSTERGRIAAAEAIAAHNPTEAALLSLTQVVGFSLSALHNLRLAVTEAETTSARLKLRANANALARTAERIQTRLDCDRTTAQAHAQAYENAQLWTDPTPLELPAEPTMETPAEPPAELAPEPPAKPPAPEPATTWSSAMDDIAAEYEAKLHTTNPKHRQHHQARINALRQTAHTLRQTNQQARRQTLLGSTSLTQQSAATRPGAVSSAALATGTTHPPGHRATPSR
jgi:hypothetical protein